MIFPSPYLPHLPSPAFSFTPNPPLPEILLTPALVQLQKFPPVNRPIHPATLSLTQLATIPGDSSPPHTTNAETHRSIEAIIWPLKVSAALAKESDKAVYHDALEIELAHRNIPFSREHPVPVLYKGHLLGTPYRPDFVCCGSIIVELKTIKSLTDIESAQVLHYLKATGLQRALLFNFATPRLEYKRFILSDPHPRPSAPSTVHPPPEPKS